MREFPVWDMFCNVGRVQAWEEGLYLSYEAELTIDKPGFIRLYCSIGDACHRLGLFSWEDGMLRCRGRVSLRSLGQEWENGTFSLQNFPFSPLKTPLDGGFLPENALLLQENGRRFVAIRHENRLPEEIMPYVCFLAPRVIDGTSCFSFEVDAYGKPVIPEQFKE